MFYSALSWMDEKVKHGCPDSPQAHSDKFESNWCWKHKWKTDKFEYQSIGMKKKETLPDIKLNLSSFMAYPQLLNQDSICYSNCIVSPCHLLSICSILLSIWHDLYNQNQITNLADQALQLNIAVFSTGLGWKDTSLATAQEDAGSKFWRMPELIEKLLDYLDEVEILTIVGVNLLTVEVLQSSSKPQNLWANLSVRLWGLASHRLFGSRGRRYRGCQTRCWPSWTVLSPDTCRG